MKSACQILDFNRISAYNASTSECFAFCRGTDISRGINLKVGNMVSGFPFEIEGIRFDNSECAYICGAFSNGTPEHNAIQGQLIGCKNGFMAKKQIHRRHRHSKREDWDSFNVQWMLYVVWQKSLGNKDFAKTLTAIPSDAVIIEDSTFQKSGSATLWGTRNLELKRRLSEYKKELKDMGLSKLEIKRRLDKRRLDDWYNVGTYEGMNLMGKILMLCRSALLTDREPTIDYQLLNNAEINLLGKVIEFPT